MNAARALVAVALASLLCACAKEHQITLPLNGGVSDEVYRINTSHMADRPYLVDGEPFSGVVVGRRGEQVVFRAQMREGRRHGVEEWFYDNGRPRSREKVAWNEKDGMRHTGDSESWCENGERRSLTEYSGGERRLAREWNCETGKLVSEATFDAEGRRDGEQKKWTPEGKLVEQASWKADALDGDKQAWTPEGTRVEHARYRGGKRQGLQEAWYASGKPASRGEYADDKPVGRHEAWAEDGRLVEAGSYAADGNKTGMWLEQHGDTSSRLHYGPGGFVPVELVAAYAGALLPPRADARKLAFYLDEGGVKPADALPTSYDGGPVVGNYRYPVYSWTYPVIVADATLLPLLLEKGADINQADSGGATRLLRCAQKFRDRQDSMNGRCLPADLQALLDKGAKADVSDLKGRNALHHLLDIGSFDDRGDVFGRGVAEAQQARVDALERLVKAGADINAADAEGWTPLVLALKSRRADLAKAALAAGARADGPGPGGTQAVHWVFLDEPNRYAIAGDFVAGMLPQLTAAGADVNAPLAWDGRQVTLRDLAVRHGLVDVARALEQHARPTQP
ncbi:hypothetical protein CQ393_11235 [Stenotrophomonas sp. MYb238]|uniref:ankyrin repeat domain-containing protein n=1 Tax=Stenotrophomonas sp. MYb238 TaxID=2040281 RepID=UPI0012918FA3|nr:ankyrin repeat domain-containing protein [Stenotrophomonas sp. MYb238]MQP76462.1 hypothetical protein [Stenotrophomonas sp. MYb238]